MSPPTWSEAYPGETRDAWRAAVVYARLLADGMPPRTIGVAGVALLVGEHASFDVVADSDRWVASHGRAWNSAPAWVRRGPVRVIATDQRLLLYRDGDWEKLAYSALEEFYADVPNRTMVTLWTGERPLRLTGPWVPYLSVHVAATSGLRGWEDLPGLQHLFMD